VELKEWIRGMVKTFAIIEVPEEKRVNMRTFCQTKTIDIWVEHYEG